MEALGDAAMIPLDTLLDFSSDFDEEEEVLERNCEKTRSLGSKTTLATTVRPQLGVPAESDSVVLQHEEEEEEEEEEEVEEEEEELEWISNQDAFPSIETTFVMKHESPVSVLESSSTGSGSSSAIISSSSCNTSFSFPVRARSKRRRPSSKGGQQWWWWWCPPKKTRLITTSTEAIATRGGGAVRKCTHCFAEKTPQWRAGPLGPKTLCNACGVRYKSGRLVPEYRPASSPSFSTELHSNSHRKILEMRRKKHKGMLHCVKKKGN